MAEFAKEVLPVNIEEEMKQSYLDYAMSVIVGRALPDVRDGLKPVHRRVLFAMRELGNDWNKPYKKSARVVGDVIGKYHPHGDSAVYDTIVRMAQPFSLRYMLVDGQGNFGSVDGDSAAAMRYTEVRMARIAHELLADIEKETVDFVPNYDGSELEPEVLPARFPHLLVNGSAGIAVGMATNIAPHNLTEVINGCLALIDTPDATIADLMQHIPGPDFPTAGIINGARGIYEAYHTGRGRIYVRARTEIEEMESGRQRIVVTELPYQVNKARLIEKIAELVKEKKIEGISQDGLRDESDKDGMRLVIELKRGEVAEVLLNNLYQHTSMQSVFGINMVALLDGQPRLLNLKQMLEAFIRHRRAVVTRRTIFDLRKARERAHVLEGLAVAMANIDPIIALIKASPNPAEAKAGLLGRAWAPGVVTDMLARAGAQASRPDGLGKEFGLAEDGYRLSEAQAQAILDLRLHRLTGLEQDKIIDEFRQLLDTIEGLLHILHDPNRLLEVIREELVQVRDQYGDARRTEIRASHEDLSLEDLISEEDVVVTLSHEGYVKAQPVADYRAQRRGGRGRAAAWARARLEADPQARIGIVVPDLAQRRNALLRALRAVMALAIGELQRPFLSDAQVEASHAVMGLDSQLIADGTYFVIEAGAHIAGCGGWSRRATAFGGDHSAGRDDSLLDPARDAARVRAMYTHPDFVRRGVGRRILELAEAAAAKEGFSRLELTATLAGAPVYRAYCLF